MQKNESSKRKHVGTMYSRHTVLLNDGLMRTLLISRGFKIPVALQYVHIRITGDNTSIKFETLISEAVNVLTTNYFFKR
jgi:hypothetical protein